MLKKYFRFTRAERSGSMILMLCCALCLLAAFLLPYVLPQKPQVAEQRLRRLWAQRLAQEQTLQYKQDIAANNGKPEVPLFPFDPNTLDSDGFTRLGLSARTTHLLLNWRRKGKHFYRPEELRSLYTLQDNDYRRLAPFITISQPPPLEGEHSPSRYVPAPPLPDRINLNEADSATLVRLPGIGPYIAQKLLNYRAALGGFMHMEQLREVFRFPDSSFHYLAAHLFIRPEDIRLIRLNTVSGQVLAQHPYIGEQMAANILLLRSGLNKFEKISQLRQVPLMNEEKYRKIAPYCTID